MHQAASAFALDPCTASKRGSMVKRARSLLSSVARLLCIADMADVHRLLATLQKVSFLSTNSWRCRTSKKLS